MNKQQEALKLALEALEETLRTLDDENAKPGGAISDTIWYSEHETLFDYLTTQITAIREALAEQRSGIKQVIELYDSPEQPAQQESEAIHAAWMAGYTEGEREAIEKQTAQQQESVAGQPLPCPFCGHIGLDFSDGDTYRWGVASCGGCGASCGDIRREYPDEGKWHSEAIAEWNKRTSPPESKPLPEDYTALEQALTRLQKRYAELEGKVGKPWVGLDNTDLAVCDTDGVQLARYWDRVLREKNT